MPSESEIKIKKDYKTGSQRVRGRMAGVGGRLYSRGSWSAPATSKGNAFM